MPLILLQSLQGLRQFLKAHEIDIIGVDETHITGDRKPPLIAVYESVQFKSDNTTVKCFIN